MEKIILTNMCLIENKKTKEVLTINRVKDWCGVAFPGGHIEEGEPIVLSVIREIKEETNLDIDNLIFCGIRDWYDPIENERNIVFMFKTSTYSGNLIEDNVDDICEFEEFDKRQYCITDFSQIIFIPTDRSGALDGEWTCNGWNT